MQWARGEAVRTAFAAFKKIKFSKFFLTSSKCMGKIMTKKIHKSMETTTMFVQTCLVFSPRQQFSQQPNMAKRKPMFSSWSLMAFVRCCSLGSLHRCYPLLQLEKKVQNKSQPYTNIHTYLLAFLVSLSSPGRRQTDIIYCDFVWGASSQHCRN